MAKRRTKAVWTRRNRNGTSWAARRMNGWEIVKTDRPDGYAWRVEQEVEEAPGLVHFI